MTNERGREWPRQLHIRHIPEEQRSRGSGEAVPLNELTPIDVMPAFIGHHFAVDPILRSKVHYFGHRHFVDAPLLTRQTAYQNLATNRVRNGRLNEALEAYGEMLAASLGFVGIISSMGDLAALNPLEARKLDFSRYDPLEEELIDAIAAVDTTFNQRRLALFAKSLRHQNKRTEMLGRLWSEAGLQDRHEDIADPDARKTVGRNYAHQLARVGQYSSAVYVAEQAGISSLADHFRAHRHLEPKITNEERRYIDNALPQGYWDY